MREELFSKEILIDRLISKIEALHIRKPTILAHVQLRIRDNDLHGAIDDLMDLRDIEAEIKSLDEVIIEVRKTK